VNVGMTESLDRKKLAEFRAVMDVHVADGVIEIEEPTLGRGLLHSSL
jgi:hypothetical protein